jgi:hypothetical protein
MVIPAARGRALDLSEEAFGWLRPSDALLGDAEALRDRLEEDGYLFVPGLLDREAVRAGRMDLLGQVALAGALDPAHPIEDGVVLPETGPLGISEAYATASPALAAVVRGEEMLGFFEDVLGGEVLAYDNVWLRNQRRSPGIQPHCDIVFMGRGTPDVLTCWTPFADVAIGGGGLMLLEGSHRQSPVRLAGYLAQDVDVFCANGPNAEAVRSGAMKWEHWDGPQPGRDWKGEICEDAVALREEWGGRWLTAPQFRMGDVLVFTMRTVHAGTDNGTSLLRLSTDTRYQRADEPVDDRWMRGEHGEEPVRHGLEAKVGKIC